VIQKRQWGEILSHQSLHNVCCTDGDKGIGTDDSRMAQELNNKSFKRLIIRVIMKHVGKIEVY